MNDVVVPDEVLALLTQLDCDAPAPNHSAFDAHWLLASSMPSVSSLNDATSDNTRADSLAFDTAPLHISDDERAMLLAILSDSNDSDAHSGAADNTASAQTMSSSSSSQTSENESVSAATSAPSDSDANATTAAPRAAPQRPETATQPKPRRIRKPRPNRKRRKHEVDALRIRVTELTEVLRRLQLSSHALVEPSTASHRRLLPVSRSQTTAAAAPSTSVWQIISAFERDEVRAAVTENARLRALYRHQLDVLQRLHTMYQSQFDLTVRSLFSC